MSSRPPRRCVTLILFVLACGSYPLRASSVGDTGLAGELHATWAGKDGAPQGIRGIAQAPNGVLWLSTIAGVYTFDGRVFTKFDAPDVHVHNRSFGRISFTRSGDLWLEPLHGAPLRIRGGEIRAMDRVDDGEASAQIANVQEAPDGTIWAMLDRHWLVNLAANDVWRRTPLPAADPKEDFTALHIDERGRTWIVLGDRLYLRSAGSDTFVPTETFVYGASSMSEAPDGGLWVASSGPRTSMAPARHLQHLDASGSVVQSRVMGDELSAVIAQPDGSLWMLTGQSKLMHLPANELSAQGTHSKQPLPNAEQLRTAVQGDGFNEMLRDRDGAIWVGGLGGLERFADATLHPLVPDALPGLWGHCVVRGGLLWVSDPQSRLLLFEGSRLLTVSPQKAEALFCSASGVLFRNDDGLWIADKSGNIRLPKPPGLQGYSNHYMFTGAVRLPDGTVVATTSGITIGRSLWRYQGGRWHPIPLPAGLPEITSMHVLSRREVLLGLLDGKTAVLEDGTVSEAASTAPGVGGIVGFTTTQTGVLAFGVNGLALLTEHRETALHFARPELVRLTTGAVEAADGSLWLNAAKGIVRVAPEEWAAARREPAHVIDANNIREGNFVGPSSPTLFSDRAQADDHGYLWFSMLNGIVSIDPQKSPKDKPPSVVVEDVLGDGRAPTANRKFAPDVSVIGIRYSGIDYRNPLGITYAYRLRGNDADWQKVGSRTEAVYTHLRVGSYIFEVKARDAFGTWSDPVSLPPFSIEPHFYERAWFRFLCSMLTLGLVWAGVQFRLHFVARTMRDKAEARADERISIARDLHDTLLQGVQGLLLTLHAAAEKVPADHESRKALERALVSTERFVVEGRDRVKGLRSFGMQAGNLEYMLNAIAEDSGCRDAISITVRHSGASIELSEHVASEIFLIAREAMLNACKHAHATRIGVQLTFAASEFLMMCKDNGQGFERGRIREAVDPARFGLRGMEERALSLGAHLEILSEPHHGTQVKLTLPSAKAYRR